MCCRTSIPALVSAALAALTAIPCALAESDGSRSAEPAAPTQRASDTRGTARRQSRTVEMYDPGFRFSGPTRQDKAVERAASRAPDGIRMEDEQAPPTPFTPPPRTLPTEPERSLWLDILYGRDEEDAAEQPVVDDPFEQLWGGAPGDPAQGQPIFDPYEQLFESYRELMQAEERKVDLQLLGESPDRDPFRSLREVDPRFVSDERSAAEFEPALANLLREAARGTDPDALERLSTEDLRALTSEPFSPTIQAPDAGNETEMDPWDPTGWRSLLAGGGAPQEAQSMASVDLPDEAPGFPIRIRRDGESARDFAGLGALRRELMRGDLADSATTTASFAPTSVEAGSAWEVDPIAMMELDESFDSAGRVGGSQSPGDRNLFDTRREGRGFEPTPVSLDSRSGLLDRLGSGGGEGTDALTGGGLEQTATPDRRIIFDPRERTDPLGQQGRFGGDVDWGGLGR